MIEDANDLYSKDINGQILYIRHAESIYNTKGKNKSHDNQVRFDEVHMDSELSENGKLQANELGKKLDQLDFKYCFVSPLQRCLQTCLISLDGKIKEKGIKVFVHPLLTEFVSGIHDLSSSIKQKEEMTKDLVDWIYFDKFDEENNSTSKDQQFYYFNFVDNPKRADDTNELMIQMKNESNYDNNKGNFKKFLQNFWNLGGRPETFNHCFKRSNDFKKFLREFKQKLILKEHEKILVFTHSLVIRLSTSDLARKIDHIENFPNDCYCPNNCEIISMLIDSD